MDGILDVHLNKSIKLEYWIITTQQVNGNYTIWFYVSQEFEAVNTLNKVL